MAGEEGVRAKARRVPRAARVAVDAALAVVLLLVMATPLAEDAAHEYLGIATVLLVAAHQVLNRRWWRAVPRGRYGARRALTTVIDVALLACSVALAASSVVLSVHAFAWLPAVPGAAWARPAHMACSFWMFALAALHLGMHIRLLPSSRGVAEVVGRSAWAVAAAGGVASWAWLDLGAYLALSVPFYAVDTASPLVQRVVAYLLLGALLALAGSVLREIVGHVGKRVDA